MPRRKVSMGLIPTRRLRLSTLGKRKEGLKKKAHELSILCGVDVALVVAAPPPDASAADAGAGGAAADVWESRDGVLARYRDLDAAARARHTLRDYLYAELGKEEAKLARARHAGPDGLDCWDKALDGVDTVEEARRLLDAVDKAILAADDRRRALGMPVDDDEEEEDGGGGAGAVLEGIAPLQSAHVDEGYLLRALAAGGGNGDAMAMALWGGNNGFFHPCSAAAGVQYGFPQFSSGGVTVEGGYDLQMVPDVYNNHGGGLTTDAFHYGHAGAMLQHGGYGFPCPRAGYFGMPSGYTMQQVVGSGAGQPNLAMSSSADEPCHAMAPVPVAYPSADTGLNYLDTQATHGLHDGSGGASFAVDSRRNFVTLPPAFSVDMSTGGGSGNFIPTPPAANSRTSTSDNFTPAQPLAMSYGGSDMTTATQSGMEQLHYLGDKVDTQPNLWEN